MQEGDHIYFGRRASEERTAAMQARHSNARKAHLDMAERYEDLVRAITEGQQRLGINVVSLNGLEVAARRH
jgi:hypothetical protein